MGAVEWRRRVSLTTDSNTFSLDKSAWHNLVAAWHNLVAPARVPTFQVKGFHQVTLASSAMTGTHGYDHQSIKCNQSIEQPDLESGEGGGRGGGGPADVSHWTSWTESTDILYLSLH